MTKLHLECDCYEETMKKACMRGVCGLNLETMTMFQPQDDQRPEPGILSCFVKYVYIFRKYQIYLHKLKK